MCQRNNNPTKDCDRKKSKATKRVFNTARKPRTRRQASAGPLTKMYTSLAIFTMLFPNGNLPLITVPSAHSKAAPTGNLLYGIYAAFFASRLAFNNL